LKVTNFKNKTLKKRESNYKDITVDDMKKYPEHQYVLVKGIHNFKRAKLAQYFLSGGRNKTHNNDLYVRYFWEVSLKEKSGCHANGGESRKYYGNDQYVINWSDEAKLTMTRMVAFPILSFGIN
jgi:hypothetical protein